MTHLPHSTILGVLCVALLAESAQATGYYVSTEGNDLNSGTSPDSPWRTLAKVSSIIYQPGDTIHLQRGTGHQRTWFETLVLRGSGTSTNPIIVTTYGSGLRPKIAPGTMDSTCVQIDGEGGWKITGLELANARWGLDLKYDVVSDRQYIWLEDLYIHDMDNLYNSDPEKYNFVSAGIAIRH